MTTLATDLAQRLRRAASVTPHNTRGEFVEEQWQLVADTIEHMIAKAVLELKIELSQGKDGAT